MLKIIHLSRMTEAAFPAPVRSAQATVAGRATDLVCSKYGDAVLLMASQLGCVGTVIQARCVLMGCVRVCGVCMRRAVLRAHANDKHKHKTTADATRTPTASRRARLARAC